MGILRKFFSAFADLFFPDLCPFCNRIIHEEDALVCARCLSKIEFICSPICNCCGKPFQVKGMEDHFCGECLSERRFYTKARAVLYYEGEVMDAIHRFKYFSAIYYSRAFGWLMFNKGRQFMDFSDYDFIIPVPLYKKRLFKREYNQSQLIAEEIGRRSGIEVELSALERVRQTPPQVGLKKEERERNVRNAFKVLKPERIKEKRILLVDDVLSTTATVNECARALRKAGAKRIDVLALARGRGIPSDIPVHLRNV